MLWNKLMQIFTSSTILMAQTAPSPVERQVHKCANVVTEILNPVDQTGPLFGGNDITFTSTETDLGDVILILSSRTGTYSAPLESAGVNRIRFQLPDTNNNIYMSYLHGYQMRARVFEFQQDRTSPGRDELDYRQVKIQRAPQLLAHIEYATYITAQNALEALTEGRIPRAQINAQNFTECSQAKYLKRSLDVVEMIVNGPNQNPNPSATRMPASAF